jgi:hypothetical protein
MEKRIENGHVRQLNQSNGELRGGWYPKSRPLKHYRKQGKTSNVRDGIEDTYWNFNGSMIHVVFNTFYTNEYGFVALSKTSPLSFEINGVRFELVSTSVDLPKIEWRTSAGATVYWETMSYDVEKKVCEPLPVYGKQLKMLGKSRPTECCDDGVISSFSGRATIRPSSSVPSQRLYKDTAAYLKSKSSPRPLYYADTSQYLRSRGNSYHVNTVLSRINGVDYVNGRNVIWPNQKQTVNGETLNSSLYESCGTMEKCNRTVYKPNNSKFATQGAVSASARLVRLRNDVKEVRTNVNGKKYDPSLRQFTNPETCCAV